MCIKVKIEKAIDTYGNTILRLAYSYVDTRGRGYCVIVGNAVEFC